MGKSDHQSSSMCCSELVISAYLRSFLEREGTAIASARAGNLIGGGHWARDRLVPDILRAFEQRAPVVIRNPHSVRPWQHVLEPLAGYLLLAQRLHDDGQACAQAWNFGPEEVDARTVQWIVEQMVRLWGGGASWRVDAGEHPDEDHHVKLDTSRGKARLG